LLHPVWKQIITPWLKNALLSILGHEAYRTHRALHIIIIVVVVRRSSEYSLARSPQTSRNSPMNCSTREHWSILIHVLHFSVSFTFVPPQERSRCLPPAYLFRTLSQRRRPSISCCSAAWNRMRSSWGTSCVDLQLNCTFCIWIVQAFVYKLIHNRSELDQSQNVAKSLKDFIFAR
jgi:hypothetical protein